MKDRFKIAVSSAAGIEGVTKKEVEKNGISGDAKAFMGRLYFEGGMEEVMKSNLLLRTGGKVYIVLGEFYANTFDELFEGIYNINLEEYILGGRIALEGKSVLSKLFAVSACQKIAEKAIRTRLKYRGASLSDAGPLYRLEISLYKDKATLLLNTSGEGLHKRGYRKLVGEAPLKESLASAIIYLSGWKNSQTLIDPFCGSGTLPIEAALIAMNVPPGKDRDFDFLKWKSTDLKKFEEIKEQALSQIKWNEKLSIQGYDIDQNQIELSLYHAKKAGVADKIHFQKRDARELSSSVKGGVIVCNPPYGQRLSDLKKVSALMREFSLAAKKLRGFDLNIFTAYKELERNLKTQADKKRKLYNGKIECCLYTFKNFGGN